MKKVLPVCVSALILFSLGACGGVPLVETIADNNATYRVDYLFEHEGCKVYRFFDRGQAVYFTNCTGTVSFAVNDSTKNLIQNSISAVD
ncbi:MAG: DUF4884 domain-containing protein [Tannerellaceae bacterium]|nr:DUF4884 domain-containing protein [Tannerellaceae bacterium]MCD8263880.1 DUF4884 domain-containing protein [Tannerellaceae bacterium]